MSTITELMRELAELESRRQVLSEKLLGAGFRSRGLVGEFGELLVMALYPGSTRGRSSEAGWDIQVPEFGRVQVKTLRSTPANPRSSIGVMKEPYDALFALRINSSYEPTAGWVIPKGTVELVYAPGVRASLTTKLLAQPGVIPVAQGELLEAMSRLDSLAEAPATTDAG